MGERNLDEFLRHRIGNERRAEWRRLYAGDNVVLQLLDYVDYLETIIRIVPNADRPSAG